MSDPRVINLAKTLVKYCVAAKAEETIAVNSAPEAEPLVLAVNEELIKAGAYPTIRMAPAGTVEAFYKYGKPHHFDAVTPLQRAQARLVDGTIHIQASSNTRALSNIDPRLQARVSCLR